MRSWGLVGGALFLGVMFIVVLEIPGMSDYAILVLSDAGQLVGSALAAVACGLAARRTTGQRRKAWWWLSAGTGAWAAGQVVWTYYEVALSREVPFPSLADVGYMIFPLASAVGLLIWLGTQSDQLVARGRDVLDGAIIAGSLLVLSWVTTLGTVFADGGEWLLLTLSLAYPIGDLILATLVLIALARGRADERLTLLVLAAGLGGLALSDSAYVYLVSKAAYSSADLISSGWVIGFLLVAASAATVSAAPDVRGGGYPDQSLDDQTPSALRLGLPYVPLLAAIGALCFNLLTAPTNPGAEVLMGVALVLLVLARQFLAMQDNHRLVIALREARDQLEHQALHDPLTGLANRVLFADRLDRALLQPSANVSVLFCDLDDFKLVNDQLGHETGDLLLQHVADRLLECVRATDTVSRLGGDEFAVLLEDSTDAVQVAERVVASMREPLDIRGETVRTSISVGIAHHQGIVAPATERRGVEPRRTSRTSKAVAVAASTQREKTAKQLLRHADMAMYAAKGAGKSRAVLADVVSGEPTESGRP